jgi:hypothetical protein
MPWRLNKDILETGARHRETEECPYIFNLYYKDEDCDEIHYLKKEGCELSKDLLLIFTCEDQSVLCFKIEYRIKDRAVVSREMKIDENGISVLRLYDESYFSGEEIKEGIDNEGWNKRRIQIEWPYGEVLRSEKTFRDYEEIPELWKIIYKHFFDYKKSKKKPIQ